MKNISAHFQHSLRAASCRQRPCAWSLLIFDLHHAYTSARVFNRVIYSRKRIGEDRMDPSVCFDMSKARMGWGNRKRMKLGKNSLKETIVCKIMSTLRRALKPLHAGDLVTLQRHRFIAISTFFGFQKETTCGRSWRPSYILENQNGPLH